MAYGGNIYGGGSFSSNCLDDIPFKLGTKFLPPTRVLLPPQIDLATVSQSRVLHEDYTFEVEEGVLKWSAEKEKQDQIRRAKTLKRQAAKARKSESSNSGDEPLYENAASSSGEPLYQNATDVQPIPKPRQIKPNCANYASVQVPNPIIASISNDILTPMPSSSPASNGANADVKRQSSKTDIKPNDIDLTWFEQERDPFDNLELQTINDMEELASVLTESNKASAAISNTSSSQPVGESSSSGVPVVNVSENAEVNEDKAESSDSSDHMYENVELRMVGLKPKSNKQIDPEETERKETEAFLPPVPPRRDIVSRGSPLPPIASIQGSNSPSSSPVPPSEPIRSVSSASSSTVSYSTQSSACQLSLNTSGVSAKAVDVNGSGTNPFQNYENVKPVISSNSPIPKPPRTFRYSRHDLDLDGKSDASTESVPTIDYTSSSVAGSESNDYENVSGYDNVKSFQQSLSNAGVPSASATASNANGVSASGSSSDLNFVTHHFGASGEESPTAGVRQEDNRPGVRVKPSRVAPPRPDRPPSFPTPAPRPSSGQSWNRYNPLPPTSTTSSNSGLTSGSQPLKVALPGLAKPEVKQRVVNDAYSRLSSEGKAAVDSVANMGFDKDRVVRAVERVGSDGKEVVEYLCLVDQLTEKGYSTHLAEMALLLFENSLTKASAYLELFTQLQELGFNGEKIKEALVNTNNDREKTLDILTASS